MRKALILAATLVIAAGACRRDQASAAASAAAGEPPPLPAPSAAPPAIDPALDDLFAFAAGLPGGSPAYAALREETAWREFADLAGKGWKDFHAAVLGPMDAWAAVKLREARERAAALFYPFGGPDLSTAQALFPGATTTVLLGLEPVGNLPDLVRSSPEWRAEFFADLGALTSDFLKRGYFITMHMMDTYTRARVDGALPVIGFFLKRGGYAVVDVRRLGPDETGGWTDAPYERLAKRPRRPYGVRIDYVKPGDPALKRVYYFSCDLENRAFTEDSPLHRFFMGLGDMTTFIKSGSYLLHWSNFSTVRQLILDRSGFVLQDDTGISYRFFKNQDWGIRLFGRYATPVKDFTNVEQLDLRAAYEDPEAKVEPLPFHFGYRWKTQVDNLLLAKRPRRPYKVPVSK